jgi:nucleotide-binding universal stress UspA family protein
MILLCYEGSPPSEHVVEAAHAILGDVKVTVLHIWEPPASFLISDSFSAWGLATIAPEQITDLDALVRERAERILAAGVALAREAGFDAEGRLEDSKGSQWRTILETADEIDASLVVIGAHAGGAVAAALLGSVSGAILHHAHRPVLIVPTVSES